MRRLGTAACACAVGILGAVVYLPSVNGEFLNYDDPYLVVASRAVQPEPVGAILDLRGDRAALGSEYLPVRDLTYAVDARLFGAPTLDGAATGFRASNVLYYGLACGLCAAFLLALLGPDRRNVALFAAVLFALHPAHAESAAWVSGRKDVVSAALVFACLLIHLRARRGQAKLYAASAGVAVLACLAKSTATAIPFLIVAIEVLNPGARENDPALGPRLRRALPTLVACGALAALAVWVGGNTGVGQRSSAWQLLGRVPSVVPIDLPILRRYVVNAFIPLQLRINHHDLLEAIKPLQGFYALSSLACLAPLAAVVVRAKKPHLWFCALWFLGGLVPVLNLIPLSQWIADRFLFLPVLGPCVAIAWFLSRAARRRERLAHGAGIALLLVWSGLAVARGLDFKTSIALWSEQRRVVPRDPVAGLHLADAYLTRARLTSDRTQATRATRVLEDALRDFSAMRGSYPAKQFEAALLLMRAHTASGNAAAALRAGLDARLLLERQGATISAQVLAFRQREVDRGLRDLAVQVAAAGDADGLELSIRALNTVGDRGPARQMLAELRTVDATRATALATELRLD